MSYVRNKKPKTILEQIKARRVLRRERTEQLEKRLQASQPQAASTTKEAKPVAVRAETPVQAKPATAQPKRKDKTTAKAKPKPKAPKKPAKAKTENKSRPKPLPEAQVHDKTSAAPTETDAVQDLYTERQRIIGRIEALEDDLQAELGNLEAVDTVLAALLPDPTLAMESPYTPTADTDFPLLEDIEYEVTKR
ncbi:hypothetical protein [Mesorhizobium sp. SP-1A]|uniref:hypothetical protein n=1 Tax=Mesorhizobium sp. SP-1A TaxID=3077840 RepID=UPI0028F6D221|nr:hypothetical protein [Mesorhizobium sp. SP-1A]